MASGATTGNVRFHLRFGWWSLLLFAGLGLGLEAMHGFKVGWYLDVAHETRRLMFRLAHAHGTLLALVHVALAATLAHLGDGGAALPRSAQVGSRALCVGSLLLPLGFALGGFGAVGGDPGVGIGLVPIGALALLTAVGAIGVALRGRP